MKPVLCTERLKAEKILSHVGGGKVAVADFSVTLLPDLPEDASALDDLEQNLALLRRPYPELLPLSG